MQAHIAKAYHFLDTHLPFSYREETQKVLKAAKIDASLDVIRNVRTGKTTSNVAVLNALLKVAKKHKKQNEKLQVEIQN
ncbi:hypothetical protein [Polaribacter atrinae]|uniref:hypothetical protein n=1 Tax=Polaribacter atrinae TaxID=1333662 RepID=UPI0030F75E91